VTTTGGTVNTLPLWTTATNIQSSVVTQTGSGSTGKIGIGTKTPAVTLDVKGAENVGGTLTLPAAGTATSTKAYNSQADLMIASVFNSGTGKAVNQKFQLQAEPVNNDKSTASGTLNLLYGSGTAAPAETGLKISPNGQITFASGQTFPGAGTVTSVGLAAPSADFTVSGSPVTGVGALNLAWNVAPTSTNTANAIVKRDASGNFAGGTITANDLETSTLEGIPISYYAYSELQNQFVANQYFVGDLKIMAIGNPGCGTGYAAVGFDGLSGCNNYSLMGNGLDLFINAPPGGLIRFRNGNTEFMTQDSSGNLVINATGIAGVEGITTGSSGDGVVGISENGNNPYGVVGEAPAVGFAVYAQGPAGVTGDLTVNGTIYAGVKDFRIDHPLDPANKYLYHSSVESSEMMNIYTGNVTTDAEGEATVKMPSWFEAVNTDFRYQLTVMGQFAQAIVGRKIENNQFTIRTSLPNVEVSWQISGVRHDAYAVAHPLVVEQAKPANEAGFYIHPDLYGQPEQKQIMWGRAPEKMLRMQQRIAKMRELSLHRASEPSAHPVIVAGPPPIRSPKATTETPNVKK
jgi:hypothetical protein